MKEILTFGFIYLFVGMHVVAAEVRAWTSQNGSTVKAEFVESSYGRVILKGGNGKRIRIPLDDLVRSDQEFILEIIALKSKAIDEKRAEFLKGSSRKKSAKTGAEKPEYMSRKEWEVLKENNLARQNPRMYLEFIEKYRKKHDGGNVFNLKHGRLMTKEGLVAVDEAIEFMRGQKSLPSVKPSAGLTLAARDHAEDIGAADIAGHSGSNGSTTRGRIENRGKWKETIGENIQFGQGDARDIIMQLIIDDGVPSRGHRTAIFNKDFKVAGVAIAKHKTYTSCCVIDYAGEFR